MIKLIKLLFNFYHIPSIQRAVHLANTIAINQGKSLNFGQSYNPRTPQDPRHPRTLQDSIICIFSVLYEHVDEFLVLIYSIKSCGYICSLVFSAYLNEALLCLTRIIYRFKQCNWHHLDAAADPTGQCHRL